MCSSYVPRERDFTTDPEKNVGKGERVSLIDQKLAEKREARKKKMSNSK